MIVAFPVLGFIFGSSLLGTLVYRRLTRVVQECLALGNTEPEHASAELEQENSDMELIQPLARSPLWKLRSQRRLNELFALNLRAASVYSRSALLLITLGAILVQLSRPTPLELGLIVVFWAGNASFILVKSAKSKELISAGRKMHRLRSYPSEVVNLSFLPPVRSW